MFDSERDTRNLLIENFVNMIDRIRLEDPYSVHVPFAQAAVHFYGEAVYEIRTEIREIEKSRSKRPDQPEEHFRHLHDLARHAIHKVETLDLSARALRDMIEQHDQFAATSSTPSAATVDQSYDSVQVMEILRQNRHQTRNQLRFYDYVIQGLRLRSVANKARLQTEIQSSFNSVTQSIARASLKLV